MLKVKLVRKDHSKVIKMKKYTKIVVDRILETKEKPQIRKHTHKPGDKKQRSQT